MIWEFVVFREDMILEQTMYRIVRLLTVKAAFIYIKTECRVTWKSVGTIWSYISCVIIAAHIFQCA